MYQVITWKELADDPKDLTSSFVSAMDLEDLELLKQLLLLDLRYLSAHRFDGDDQLKYAASECVMSSLFYSIFRNILSHLSVGPTIIAC